MQLQCFVASEHPSATVPWDYPFALTAWVYRVLNQTDLRWGDAAHAVLAPRTSIRPFALSWLQFPTPPTTTPLGLQMTSPLADFIVGTYDVALAEALQTQGPKEALVLGGTRFWVSTLVPLPDSPSLGPWHCASPVVISQRAEGRRRFLAPDDPAFWTLAAQNLAHKVQQFHGVTIDPATIRIVVTNRPRRKRILVHGHPIVGWQWDTPVHIEGSPLVQDVARTLGLGVYNSNGFGHLEPLRPEDEALLPSEAWA